MCDQRVDGNRRQHQIRQAAWQFQLQVSRRARQHMHERQNKPSPSDGPSLVPLANGRTLAASPPASVPRVVVSWSVSHNDNGSLTHKPRAPMDDEFGMRGGHPLRHQGSFESQARRCRSDRRKGRRKWASEHYRIDVQIYKSGCIDGRSLRPHQC